MKGKRVRLGELVTIKARIGWQGLTRKEHLDTGEYYLITGTDFDDGNVDFERCKYVAKERFDQDPNIQIRNGDILITKDGTIGKVALVQGLNKCATLNSGVFVLRRLIGDVNLKYLYHFFYGPEFRRLVDQSLTGCTIPHLNQAKLVNFMFPLPPLTVQRKIAEELDRICALKRAAEKVVEKLGVFAKAKFVEMFGDGKFEKRPLASCVKEMFIGPFGSALKNECFIMKDKSYCMVYEQKHAICKSMDVDTRYVGKDKYEELKRFVVLPGDLIVSCRGTIGEIYRIPDDAPMGIMHPSIMKIRLDERLYDTTYFMQALSSYMKTESARANGSSVKMAITATALGMEMFIVPPLPLQRQFAAYVGKVEKIEAAAKKVVEKLDVLYRAKLQEYFA